MKSEMNTEKAFAAGHDAGIEAIEKLAEQFDGKHSDQTYKSFAGLLTVIMHCVYFQAPSEGAAEELITIAQAWAKENARKEKGENS